MHRLALISASLAMLIAFIVPASAQSRLALVIANSAYQDAAPLNTTIADATLIAATLQAAGYDVTGLTNVGKDDIGSEIGQFRDKIAAAGPDAVAFLYFAGYGAQLNGDDYLVPVDAQIDSPDALNSQALPLSAIVSTLAQVPAAARIIVLDAARDHEFGKKAGQPVAPGLALIGAPPPGFLIAYSAAPNQVAPDGGGPNSPFASALATLMRQPGLDIEQILKGVRVQVNQASKGTQTPWMTSSLDVEVKLFEAPPAAAAEAAAPTQATAAPAQVAAAPRTLAPALGVANIPVPHKRKRHVTKAQMKQMPADEAYRAAIEDDSLPDYQAFVETHPDYSLAGQVWNIIHNIREGVLWDRVLAVDSTAAYWDYLDRYPNGDHAWEARNWLESHGQPLPPPDYAPQPLDLPPGYYDEATDVPEIFPDGSVAPAPVFGDYAPIFVPPPPRWDRRPIIINVQPAPPIPNVAPAQTPVAPLTPPDQSQANGALPPLSPNAPLGPTPVTPLPPSNQTQANGALPLVSPNAPLGPTPVTPLPPANQTQANVNPPTVSPTPDLKKMTDQQLKDALAAQIANYKAEQAKKQAALAKKFNLPPSNALPNLANVID